MIRSLILTASLTIGLTTVATAGFVPSTIRHADGLLTRVAEGCGPGWWRGPEGRCHPMARGRACPRGYHLGAEGGRCCPNGGDRCRWEPETFEAGAAPASSGPRLFGCRS